MSDTGSAQDPATTLAGDTHNYSPAAPLVLDGDQNSLVQPRNDHLDDSPTSLYQDAQSAMDITRKVGFSHSDV